MIDAHKNQFRLIRAIADFGVVAISRPWLSFLVFIFLGIAITAFYAAADAWHRYSEQSARDRVLYDACLAERGNVVACDAVMRIIKRQRQ